MRTITLAPWSAARRFHRHVHVLNWRWNDGRRMQHPVNIRTEERAGETPCLPSALFLRCLIDVLGNVATYTDMLCVQTAMGIRNVTQNQIPDFIRLSSAEEWI